MAWKNPQKFLSVAKAIALVYSPMWYFGYIGRYAAHTICQQVRVDGIPIVAIRSDSMLEINAIALVTLD